MRSDAVYLRSFCGEQARGPRMQGCAKGRCDVSGDRLLDDRVHERQHLPSGQHIGCPQDVRGNLPSRTLQTSEHRRVTQRRARPEHSQRARHLFAVNTQPAEAHEHVTADRAGA
jgi:hypothetical protein